MEGIEITTREIYDAIQKQQLDLMDIKSDVKQLIQQVNTNGCDVEALKVKAESLNIRITKLESQSKAVAWAIAIGIPALAGFIYFIDKYRG